MMGLGKHIHGLELYDGEAGTAQLAQVPAEGGGVAGDIDQPFTGKGCQVSREARNALSGRVDDHAVKAPAFCYQCLAAFMDWVFLKEGVGEACSLAVYTGRADR